MWFLRAIRFVFVFNYNRGSPHLILNQCTNKNYKLYLIFFSLQISVSKIPGQTPQCISHTTPQGTRPNSPVNMFLLQSSAEPLPPFFSSQQQLAMPLLPLQPATSLFQSDCNDDDAIDKILSYLKDDSSYPNMSFQMSLDTFSSGSSDD